MATTFDTEIRKLQPVELYTLAHILNQSDSWKKLMAIIPSETNDHLCLFNSEHFRIIEQASRQQQRSAAEIFLSEWSTLNKKRPTCRSMLNFLVKAELFRAADYLAVDILKGEPPKRPKTGPAAAVDVSDQALEELLRRQVKNLKVKYDPPENITNNSWSLHYENKAMKAIDDCAENNAIESDLIKFSSPEKEMIEDSPPKLSDFLKFSNTKADEEFEVGEFVLQEAQSEDIPLCVRENAFKPMQATSSVETENSESLTSIESSDIIAPAVPNESINYPNVSQNLIPLVVLEYNERSKKNKNNT